MNQTREIKRNKLGETCVIKRHTMLHENKYLPPSFNRYNLLNCYDYCVNFFYIHKKKFKQLFYVYLDEYSISKKSSVL